MPRHDLRDLVGRSEQVQPGYQTAIPYLTQRRLSDGDLSMR